MKSIELLREREKHLWDIGDALLKETDGSTAQLKDCAAELLEHGHERTIKELRQFRETSAVFPPEARKDCSWEHHRLCRRDPFVLDLVLAANPEKIGNKKTFIAHALKMRKRGWRKEC